MPFLSGGHSLTGWHCKLRSNTEGCRNQPCQYAGIVLAEDCSKNGVGAVQRRTLPVFRRHIMLEDAVEFHAFASLEVNMLVTNGIPLGRPLSYRLVLQIASSHERLARQTLPLPSCTMHWCSSMPHNQTARCVPSFGSRWWCPRWLQQWSSGSIALVVR